MGLYNMINGTSSGAAIGLHILGLSISDIPRFRDCYFKDDFIVVFTRTGGGNRDEYDVDEHPYGSPTNNNLRNHPYYVSDRDAEYDSTYALFFFSIPHEIVLDEFQLESLKEEKHADERMRENTQKLIDALGRRN